MLLLMHIIDARIYADLEFEIHPSIPLINCQAMTVIEEIDDADTKSSADHDTIKDTPRVNSKYIIQEVKD